MSKITDAFHEMKERGEVVGIVFIAFGIALLIFQVILLVNESATQVFLLGASLAVISVGLGFISVGMSAKSDKRYTALLERLDRNIARLPTLLKGDMLSLEGQQLAKQTAKVVAGKQSKIAAQARLDEDTKRVGYVRGEIFERDDGSWSVGWGGKYPL